MQEPSGPVDRWLLLLPCLPQEVSLHTLRIAYGPALTPCIQRASELSKQSARTTILDVAVDCRGLSVFDYSTLQNIFGQFYKMVCILCIEQMVDLQFENDVDARVYLFHDPKEMELEPQSARGANQTRWPNIQQISRCQIPWTQLCSLESESGESLTRLFLQAREDFPYPLSSGEVLRLPGGLTLTDQGRKLGQSSGAFRQHLSVAVGGTFDHMHAGHKLLLTMTALLCQTTSPLPPDKDPCITIGITGDALLKNKKFREHMEDWDQRQTSVKAFLNELLQMETPSHTRRSTKTSSLQPSQAREVVEEFESGLRIRYTEIFDPFGPTITDPAITALALSAETRGGGRAVNDERQKKGWDPLEIFEVDVLDAEENADSSSPADDTFQNKLSSTEIRAQIHKRTIVK